MYHHRCVFVRCVVRHDFSSGLCGENGVPCTVCCWAGVINSPVSQRGQGQRVKSQLQRQKPAQKFCGCEGSGGGNKRNSHEWLGGILCLAEEAVHVK